MGARREKIGRTYYRLLALANKEKAVLWYDESGRLHREDGPAIVHANGNWSWYRRGRLHREHGPALKKKTGMEWWQNGKRHRLGGPSGEYNDGVRMWHQAGVFHREDGPAIMFTDSRGEYYWHGEYLTEEKFREASKLERLSKVRLDVPERVTF